MAFTAIKLNNIPHGFYETEMEKYFSQFGKVRQVALARSEKTRRSRGFAFIEFVKHETAKAAAESMNNYLMFDHVLKCKLVDVKKVSRALKRYSKKTKTHETSVEKYKKQHNVSIRNRQYLVKHYKKILRTQKVLDKMGVKLDCKIINAPVMDVELDSITSGSTNSGETFSATTSDTNSVC